MSGRILQKGGDGDHQRTLGTRLTSGVSEKPQAGDERGNSTLQKTGGTRQLW